MNPTPFMPAGTVYGTLLNSQDEWATLAAQMDLPPYKAAPKAPVLFIKTANTWSKNGGAIPLPARVPQVEIGATISMLIGRPAHAVPASAAMNFVAGFVLMNDLSIPHASFFRPPVKFKNLDGFLGIGPQLATPQQVGDPAALRLEVRINGEVRQTVDFSKLVRSAAQLLANVSEFMTLHPGDVLMLGCGAKRPLARAGDRIDISAPGVSALGTLSNTLVEELDEGAPS
jgi:5-oxopent-3-ene-1,2,5-tricarboxylate decarboxylase/2-hydroxyhepta-2,4-diene-1,7-dioate isomerase